MQNNRNAFTMIELIFVIVILGILATVAIPKLAATSTDANIAKLSNNIMQGASEIAAYAMSQAQIDSDLSVMSNALTNLAATGDAVLASNKATITCGTVSNCVEIVVDSNATTGVDTLNINFSNANSDAKCIALQNVIDAQQYPMKLRGRSAKFQ